ncbi:MAG: RnfABCDGE type electron transport complex subunit D, partial [Enterococcus hulanensis]
MDEKRSFEAVRSEDYPMMEASPHLLSQEKTDRIMQLVLLALLPSVLVSIIFFGIRSLLLYIIAVGTCLFCEFLWFKFRKNAIPKDFSAAVTGVLLAMSLPASVPLWYPALGGAIGIIVAKELFGGIGRNLLNPALTGRAVLRL